MPVTVNADLTELAAAFPTTPVNRPSVTNLEPLFYDSRVHCDIIRVRQAVTAGQVIRVRRDMRRCRILGTSFITRTGSTIASLTLDIGYQDFTLNSGAIQTGSITGIATAVDVAAAGVDSQFLNGGVSSIFIDAYDKWDLLIRPNAANLTASDVLDIVLFYSTEGI